MSNPYLIISKPLAWFGCCVILTFYVLPSPFSRIDTCFQQERRWRTPFLGYRVKQCFTTLSKFTLVDQQKKYLLHGRELLFSQPDRLFLRRNRSISLGFHNIFQQHPNCWTRTQFEAAHQLLGTHQSRRQNTLSLPDILCQQQTHPDHMLLPGTHRFYT